MASVYNFHTMRMTGCGLTALKLSALHTIAHMHGIYIDMYTLSNRDYTYARIVQRSISLHHLTLSVDQKLQINRIKV